MPAEPFGEPVADQFGLMARGIVHDDVNVEISGHMLFDGVEEAAEFLRPVARHAFADDGSGLYVEGGKQRGRPVPLVVMGVPFDCPGRIGSSGWVRSSAWICDFSSTQSKIGRASCREGV